MYSKEDTAILVAPSAVQYLQAAGEQTLSCKDGHACALVQACSAVVDRTEHNLTLHAPATEMRTEHQIHK